MNKRVNYNAREFAGRIKTLRKRECQRCRGSYRSEKRPWRTRSLWFAGRRGDCIWLVHVIFPHVQMTCQLPLNYMRHLDQSAQCQRWLILFIVAAMTVPVETERHKKTQSKALWEGLGEGCRGRDSQGRVDSWFLQLMIRYATKNKRWKPFPESGNGLRHVTTFGLEKKKKSWCCLLTRKSQRYCSAQSAICLHTLSCWWMSAKSFEYHVQLKSRFYTHQNQLLSVIFTSASHYLFQFNIANKGRECICNTILFSKTW